MKKQQAIKKVKSLYTGVNSYSLDENDPYNKLKEKNKNDVFSTYGEIIPAGVNKIINNISIDENDVFFDLGCGCGKVVTQFYYQTCVKSSNGVEFSTTRFLQAQEIKEKIKKNEVTADRLKFYRSNFVNKNLDLSKGTIFYSCSTCFSDDLMKKIWDKISDNKNLNAIIILKDFPETCDFSRVKRTKSIEVPCTWAKSGAKIYYFK
jgi:Histone methylation protein DOT1